MGFSYRRKLLDSLRLASEIVLSLESTFNNIQKNYGEEETAMHDHELLRKKKVFLANKFH